MLCKSLVACRRIALRIFSFPIKFTTKEYNIFRSSLFISTLLAILCSIPSHTSALSPNPGRQVFELHCSACHINGGNIIRRGKNLKLKTLKEKGIDNREAIAKIAREGIGIMSGYEEVLGNGEDQIVASWILEQAQKAWVQG